ncbi:XMAP215 family protein [Leishmania donovani]|uniref:CLASP_N_inal_putative/Pfam:PF12348 n=1 Tax=Leishmania donovani TaxID=5661 RepID=A0A6J8FGH8_LEIDO|nr:XMAP215 family protein [Leishmania donovani]VDZ46816.1 CLASP_N_inal_putative/Pfam:PF12348 [Leishmania donovani]
MSVDDRRIGDEMDSKPLGGPSGACEDFSSCSVSEVLWHSHWKARKNGYERVQKDPIKYKKLLFDSLKYIANEGNATVQEAAIEALVIVLSECNDSERSQLAEGTLPIVVEKGITGRPKAVQLSQQFIFALVEAGSGAAVFAALLPALAHKAPKNRLAAAQTAASLVSDYGVQHFPLKEILKAMQPLFNDANAQVRKEAIALCCQCYRYIGANIRGFLTDLREVQLQELQKQFESLKVGERPPKMIKGAERSSSDGKGGKNSLAAAKPIGSLTGEDTAAVDDAGFELLEESLIIPRLPKKFFRVALDKETTWQDRVEYVNVHLVPLLAAPRFRAKDNYHELASMMKEYLVDPQAPLMLLGFKMVQDCARGLRNDFSPHARLFVAPLLGKMKDKKVSVQLHVMKTLEDLICFNCISMDQCNDDFEQALQSKNPTQRTVLLNYLIRMVDTLGDRSRYVKLGRSIAMLTRAVNDEKASIRDVAYVLLDRLIRAFGEAQYKSVLEHLDDNQRHNMAAAVARGAPTVGPRSVASRQASDLSISQSGGTTGTTPFNSPAKKIPRVEDSSAATAALARPPQARTISAPCATVVARRLSAFSREDGADADAEPRGTLALEPPRTSSLLRKSAPSHASGTERPSVARSCVAATRGSGAEQSSTRTNADDSIALESLLPSKMESLMMILGMLNGDNTVLDMVRSREWARRQEGMNKLFVMVQQWTPAQTTRAMDYLVVYIRAHPSFREPTFQVFTLITQVFQVALAKAVTLTMAAGYAIVSGFTSRFAEPKNKPLVREVCGLIAQKLGQRFVVRHILDTAAMIKTPKLLQEVCEYVREAVQHQPDSEEAERDAVDARGALHFVKTVCSDFNNAGVRQEAALLLVALRRSPQASAAAVERCVASLQPPLPALYERELNRSEGVSTFAGPLAPTRASVALPAGAPAPGAAAPTPLSPTQKRARTVSQSSGPGTRASVLAPSSPNRPSVHRRSLSDAEASPDFHHRTSSPGGTGVATRLTSGHASSLRPLPRNSCSASAAPPGGLRSILHEITSGEDWRDRLNGVRRAEAFVAEAPRPLPGHCAVALLKALQGRFEEANKNIIVDVLRFIPVVVNAAGPEECRAALRQLTPGVLAMLGDQKAALREEARNVAFFAMNVVGLESLLPLLQRPLSSDSNVCRQNVLEMMVSGFEQLPADAALPRVGMQLLTPAVIASIMDRLLDVRLVAEQVLGWMLGVVGEDIVMHSVQQLKPAEQQAVMPAVERQIEHRRRQAQEGRPEGQQDQLPSTAKAGQPFLTVANGLLDNEESRRTTPRRATPRASSPATPRVANGGFTTPRRLSAAHIPYDTRSAINTQQNGNRASTPTLELAPKTRPAHKEAVGVTAAPSAPSTAASESGEATPAPASSNGPAARASAHPSRPSAASKAAVPAKTSPPSNASRTPTTSTDISPLADGNEELYTIREILVGLRSATSDVALAMCKDFCRHLRAGVDCGTPEVVQVMVERLYENTQNFDSGLAQALTECLAAMFMTPRCAMRCHSQLLFRMMGAFFDCLLSEKFSLHEPVIKALNVATLKLLEGCPANDVFTALLSRLTTYSTIYLSTAQKADLKFLQVTVKCVMRVDLTKVSADTIILCCHEYLLQHPPSAFRNLDDLPIRTVKTVLQTTTKRLGASLLTTAETLVGPQNLVTHFIRACLELRNKTAKERGQNEQQAIEESRHEQRASQSPTPLPAKEKTCSPLTPPNNTMASTSVTSTAATAARTATPGTTATAATASVTPSKGTVTPSRRKKRVSHHADPNATPASSLNATTVASPGASCEGSFSPSAPACSVRAPLKAHSRLQAGAAAGQSAPESSTANSSIVVTPSKVTPQGVLNGPASSSQANAPTASPRDIKRDLTEIFAHIRNHVTSSSGIDELYSFLKDLPPSSYEEAFRVHFNRCSEAFRLYIKRKLERKVEEDPTKPVSFKLPAVIQHLS